MHIQLVNESSTLDLHIEPGVMKVSAGDEHLVVDTEDLLYKHFNFARAGSYKLVYKDKKRIYDVTSEQMDAILGVFGGRSFVMAELRTMFKGGVFSSIVILIVAFSVSFDERPLGLTDYMLMAGSLAHSAIAIYGRLRLKPVLYIIMIYFYIYYAIFWLALKYEHGGTLPLIIAVLMLVFYVAGLHRYTVLRRIEQVPAMPR